jgi:hypothetical protein
MKLADLPAADGSGDRLINIDNINQIVDTPNMILEDLGLPNDPPAVSTLYMVGDNYFYTLGTKEETRERIDAALKPK